MAADHSGDISPGGGGRSPAPFCSNNAPDGDGAGASGGSDVPGLGVAASSTTTRGDADNSESDFEVSYEPGSNGSRGTIRWADGDVYEGELKDGEPHGKGSCRYSSADGVRIAYDGNWKDGWRERGVMTYQSGDVYDGQWGENGQHGHGTYAWASGAVYDGEWKDGKRHGIGTMTYDNGDVFDGEWRDGLRHGKGSLKWESGGWYVGEFAEGKMHGWGEMTYADGDKIEGKWADGEHASCKEVRGASGSNPKASHAYHERKVRSQRSQQRRLQNEMAAKKCDHCEADDVQYKLRVCSGCNLALYCSAACQKAARGSHQRICDIISDLPERDAERLDLEFDGERKNDFDAGLRYATKYMGILKYLTINIKDMRSGDELKLSAKQLSSLLRSKTGQLESVFWFGRFSDVYVPGVSKNGDAVWKELHGLKRLCLEFMRFDDVQSVRDIICQQRDTLQLLSLSYLNIDWTKAKTRRTIAEAVGSCKSLVTLDLAGCVFTDPDLKIMLQDLPNLRILLLRRQHDESHGFTDKTCGLIARKCPGLQSLNLHNHNQLSVKGLRKIFEGCPNLRSCYTTTRKLNCTDIQTLLDVAPQLLHLALSPENGLSDGDLDKIIESTCGRTVIQWSNGGIFDPNNISAKTRDNYDRQGRVLSDIWSKGADPEVSNKWAGVLK